MYNIPYFSILAQRYNKKIIYTTLLPFFLKKFKKIH